MNVEKINHCENNSDALPDLFVIDQWHIDCNQNIAKLGNREVKIEPKAMMILQYLSSKPGQTVLREELFAKFWRNQVVTEDALNRVISSLRKTFKDTSSQPKYIATVRNAGYKLILPVTILENPRSPKIIKAVAVTTIDENPQPTPNHTIDQDKQRLSLSNKPPSPPMYLYGLVLLCIALLAFIFISVEDAPPPLAFTRISYDKPQNLMPSISFDGEKIVYIAHMLGGRKKLMLRQLSSNFAKSIGSNKVDYHHPAFSPDGQFLAVVSQNSSDNDITLNLLDLDSGEHQPLLALKNISKGLSWHPNANYIAYTQTHLNQANNGIYLWDIKQQQPRLLVPEKPGADDNIPLFSPDGENLAFVRSTAHKENAIFITGLNGLARRVSPNVSDIYGFDWLDLSVAASQAVCPAVTLGLSQGFCRPAQNCQPSRGRCH